MLHKATFSNFQLSNEQKKYLMFRHYTLLFPFLVYSIFGLQCLRSQNPVNIEHEGNKRNLIILTNFMKFVCKNDNIPVYITRYITLHDN